jgi:flagellar L-ring protein precursor FlgH
MKGGKHMNKHKKSSPKVVGRFPLQPLVFLLLATSTLSACSVADRALGIGSPPKQSKIQDPTMAKGYNPVTMPMPVQTAQARQANSLWTGAQKGFFKDQRADEIGDILTVVIDIDDKGEIKNESTRSRSASENAATPRLLGLETDFSTVLNQAVDPTNLAEVTADSNHRGTGEIDREEKIELKMAATVTQILPNGNMVIQGSQEVRVNFENRVLTMAGIIRPEDIAIDNSISYEKIAEARIAYGGKGQITDYQQPRYGQQIFDIIMPF